MIIKLLLVILLSSYKNDDQISDFLYPKLECPLTTISMMTTV